MATLQALSPHARTSTRDSQRSKVYAAENSVFGRVGDESHIAVITERETEQWIKRITTSKWWNTRVAQDGWPRMRPRVTFAARGAGASASRGGTLRFCPGARRRWIILHELAHHATPRDPGHGWEFCQAYLRLVRKWLGAEHEAELKAAFKKCKVRYTKPRTRNLTPEQRAAAAERLAAARAARQGETGRFALRYRSNPPSNDPDRQLWVSSVSQFTYQYTSSISMRKIWKTRAAAQRWADTYKLEVVDLDSSVY